MRCELCGTEEAMQDDNVCASCWSNSVECAEPTIAKLRAQVEIMEQGLERISSGTEDRLPPFRAMPPDRMQSIANETLKKARGAE